MLRVGRRIIFASTLKFIKDLLPFVYENRHLKCVSKIVFILFYSKLLLCIAQKAHAREVLHRLEVYLGTSTVVRQSMKIEEV